ncbi:hypothetical protein HPB51_018444 [Rhipicephalus microplus]|uniref:Uncharacterized protein n=1 Tax=Rhipicephalus microplus TaxID=6941 RepID=A0A9J6D700_RHIMP|nr:hypothetical protein HPB51_018444 [Rhipicephalus microplus]
MEQSVKHLSEQYDDVLIEMRKQSCEIATLKKRVEKAEAANDPLEIQKLRQHLNYLEQYSRRQNLEIHGIPHSQGEQLLGKLNNLAKQLNLAELTPANIDGLHRLPPKPGFPRNVSLPLIRELYGDNYKITRLGITFVERSYVRTKVVKETLWHLKKQSSQGSS